MLSNFTIYKPVCEAGHCGYTSISPSYRRISGYKEPAQRTEDGEVLYPQSARDTLDAHILYYL